MYSDVKNTIYVVSLESTAKPTTTCQVRIEITKLKLVNIILKKLALKVLYYVYGWEPHIKGAYRSQKLKLNFKHDDNKLQTGT